MFKDLVKVDTFEAITYIQKKRKVRRIPRNCVKVTRQEEALGVAASVARPSLILIV